MLFIVPSFEYQMYYSLYHSSFSEHHEIVVVVSPDAVEARVRPHYDSGARYRNYVQMPPRISDEPVLLSSNFVFV